MFILAPFIIIAARGILGTSSPTTPRMGYCFISCFYLKHFPLYHSKRNYLSLALPAHTKTFTVNSILALFNVKSITAAGQFSVVDACALHSPVVTVTSSGKSPAWGGAQLRPPLQPSTPSLPQLAAATVIWDVSFLFPSIFPSKDVLQCFPVCLPHSNGCSLFLMDAVWVTDCDESVHLGNEFENLSSVPCQYEVIWQLIAIRAVKCFLFTQMSLQALLWGLLAVNMVTLMQSLSVIAQSEI